MSEDIGQEQKPGIVARIARIFQPGKNSSKGDRIMPPGSSLIASEETHPSRVYAAGDEITPRLDDLEAYSHDAPATEISISRVANTLWSVGFQIVASESFDPVITDGIPADLQLQRLLATARRLGQKMDRIGEVERDIGYVLEIVKVKRNVLDMLASGKFLATGLYCDDLDLIAQSGGLMSPIHRLKKGLIQEENIARWGAKKYSDASAVFFAPWQYPSRPRTFYTGPGTYTSAPWDFRGDTDMTVIYPAYYIVTHCLGLEIRGGYDWDDLSVTLGDIEIAVTNSPSALREGGLTAEGDDATFLPLEDAYLIIPQDKYQKAKSALSLHRYSEDWQASHLYQIGDIGRTYRDCKPDNEMRRVLYNSKNDINQWLQIHCLPDPRTLKLKMMRKSFSSLGTYFYVGRLAP